MMNRPAPAVPSADIPVEAMLAEVRKPPGPVWWGVFLASALLAAWGIGWSSWRIAAEGAGVLGVNNNVVWGLDIVHFVFWIGLGHAGTLISAVLLLTRQSWRSPIARGAEQMTLCAVICAAVFPVVHVGRVWMAWMASPLPEVSGIWPDMASPLMWDVMAVSTYFLLSLLYWYIGLVPDFALLRDCCKGRLRRRYGWLALGWQGTGRQWRAYEKASLLFAVILTPLVVSVHSVVSFDFSVTQVSGWHQSIFPPYFVGGAILSGMAMVQLILLGVSRLMAGSGVRQAVTPAILDLSSRLVLALSLVMGAMYLWEHLAAILNGGAQEPFPGRNPVNAVFIIVMVAGNVALPQLFWFRPLRTNRRVIASVALGVLAGMWMERFWIVVNSLKASLLAANIGDYFPSVTDLAMMAGSVGLFMALYMALVRMAPFFSLCDVREQQSLNKEGGA
ncbi:MULTISPECIES: NrfD/PsrC family molybdoenzyme membrane anchor subunit [unclassified Akkermansia]|uniref:NrfD/PsrC family molybdoenzyme membrane anchor subunit n=1 Tax=unclassified Akkermansia TaxID=2608915 RepID=UPI0025BEB57D|nr:MULTISPECIES: NrfD/PsrC family molybdoenzyme membrane anchor subunit [unclassified Akkermansia]